MGKTDSITFEYRPDGGKTPGALPYLPNGVNRTPFEDRHLKKEFDVDSQKIFKALQRILDASAEYEKCGNWSPYWNGEGDDKAFGDIGRQQCIVTPKEATDTKSTELHLEKVLRKSPKDGTGITLPSFTGTNTDIEASLPFPKLSQLDPKLLLERFLQYLGIDSYKNIDDLLKQLETNSLLPLIYEMLFHIHQNVSTYAGLNGLISFTEEKILLHPIMAGARLGLIISPSHEKNTSGIELTLLYNLQSNNGEDVLTIKTKVKITSTKDHEIKRSVQSHKVELHTSAYTPYFLRFSPLGLKGLFVKRPQKIYELILAYNKRHPKARLPTTLIDFTLEHYFLLKKNELKKFSSLKDISLEDVSLKMFSLKDQLSFTSSKLSTTEANAVISYATKHPEMLFLTNLDATENDIRHLQKNFTFHFMAADSKIQQECLERFEEIKTSKPEWLAPSWFYNSNRAINFLNTIKLSTRTQPTGEQIVDQIKRDAENLGCLTAASRKFWFKQTVMEILLQKLHIKQKLNYDKILRQDASIKDVKELILLSGYEKITKLLCNRSFRDRVIKALHYLTQELITKLEEIQKESNEAKRIQELEALDTQAKSLIAFTVRFEKRAFKRGKQTRAVITLKEQLKTVKKTVETEELIEKDKKEILEIEAALQMRGPSVIKKLKPEKIATHPLLDGNANPFKETSDSSGVGFVDSTGIFQSLMESKIRKWEKPDPLSNKEDSALCSNPQSDDTDSSLSRRSSISSGNELLSDPLNDSDSLSSTSESDNDLLSNKKDAVSSASIVQELGYESGDSFIASDDEKELHKSEFNPTSVGSWFHLEKKPISSPNSHPLATLVPA